MPELDSRITIMPDGSYFYSGSIISDVRSTSQTARFTHKPAIIVGGHNGDRNITGQMFSGYISDTVAENIRVGLEEKYNDHLARKNVNPVTVQDVLLHWKMTGQCRFILNQKPGCRLSRWVNQGASRTRKMYDYNSNYGFLVKCNHSRRKGRKPINLGTSRTFGKYSTLYLIPFKGIVPKYPEEYYNFIGTIHYRFYEIDRVRYSQNLMSSVFEACHSRMIDILAGTQLRKEEFLNMLVDYYVLDNTNSRMCLEQHFYCNGGSFDLYVEPIQ